jgi:hypothetical protein
MFIGQSFLIASRYRGMDQRLCTLRADWRAVGLAVGDLLGNSIEIGGRRMLGFQISDGQQRRADEQ